MNGCPLRAGVTLERRAHISSHAVETPVGQSLDMSPRRKKDLEEKEGGEKGPHTYHHNPTETIHAYIIYTALWVLFQHVSGDMFSSKGTKHVARSKPPDL